MTRPLPLILAALLAAAGPAAAGSGLVACSTTDNAYAFDLATYAVGPVIDLLPEGNYPYDATINPAGTEVWVCGAAGDGVVVLDRASGAVLHRITTGEYPVSIAFSDDGALALVACRDSDRVDIIDTAAYAVTGSLPVPSNYLGPGNLALDPVSKRFYLVEWYDDLLYEIAPDGSAILRQVSLGSDFWQLVVAPDGSRVYVTDRGTDQVRVVETAGLTQVNTLPVGDDPWGIDVTADGMTLVVACEDDGTIHAFDTATWSSVPLAPLPAGATPRDVDIDDAAGLAYIPGGQAAGDDPVFYRDLTGGGGDGSFTVPGSNTNVVAVQAQMNSGGTDAPGSAPAAPALACWPNPFNPKVTVRFRLPAPATVDLAAYDCRGRRLAILASGPRIAGEHVLTWDGRDAEGRPLASGVYLLRLRAGGHERCLRAVLLK
ncbi:MAG: beta-propeller fold lactonase family protein [Candidatus Krumholzibacteriota bacterium]|nr:beta-propeller fold lactonase family protein [Candidatus Krumholzibacteriota bacterium]